MKMRIFVVMNLALLTGIQQTPAQSVYTPYTFTTLAGSAGYGSVDGTGSAARFWGPSSVAVDNAGNIYVADSGNKTVRKVTPSGVVTTLAGLAGSQGSADGTGNAGRFFLPAGLAVDSTGNVYVADSLSCTIRKVTAAGVVTTLAGLAGSQGSTDGTGSAARFLVPTSVAVDKAGNVYVADDGNRTIRKVTSAGVVTTVAGRAGSFGNADGNGSTARFGSMFGGPSGIAMDNAGNGYVADKGSHTIRKVTPEGVVTTLAGMAGKQGSVDGTGSSARFNSPSGVAVDGAGNVYVADTRNSTIRKVSPAGVVTTLAGKAGSLGSTDGKGNVARFGMSSAFGPTGVAVDANGNVYVADSDNATIRKVTPEGVVTTLAGLAAGRGSVNGTGSAARFANPTGVAVDNAGNSYVADTGNHTIRKVTPEGTVTTLAGLAGSLGSVDGTGSTARFNSPFDLTVDSAGNVYVADTGNKTVRKVTSAGAVTTPAGMAGSHGSADGAGSAARFGSEFGGPSGVAVDSAGNVYVADTDNHTIRKVTPSGMVTTLAGDASIMGKTGKPVGGDSDGRGATARFNYPWDVAVDAAGNIYVADSLNHTIRKVTPVGVVATLAGLAGSQGSADGMGSAARFWDPSGVAVDSAGNVYVADTGNRTIRKVTPTGAVTTLAGLAGSQGSADGTGSIARFGYPTAVAVDSAGDVYVADSENNSIRKGVAASSRP